MSDETEKLKEENKELRERLSDLERFVGLRTPTKPASDWKHQPVDYTAGASVDPETLRELARAIPPNIQADIRRTLNARPAAPSQEPAKAVVRGSGFQEPTPLGAPPGVALADKLVDAADVAERIERMRKLWFGLVKPGGDAA